MRLQARTASWCPRSVARRRPAYGAARRQAKRRRGRSPRPRGSGDAKRRPPSPGAAPDAGRVRYSAPARSGWVVVRAGTTWRHRLRSCTARRDIRPSLNLNTLPEASAVLARVTSMAVEGRRVLSARQARGMLAKRCWRHLRPSSEPRGPTAREGAWSVRVAHGAEPRGEARCGRASACGRHAKERSFATALPTRAMVTAPVRMSSDIRSGPGLAPQPGGHQAGL